MVSVRNGKLCPATKRARISRPWPSTSTSATSMASRLVPDMHPTTRRVFMGWHLTDRRLFGAGEITRWRRQSTRPVLVVRCENRQIVRKFLFLPVAEVTQPMASHTTHFCARNMHFRPLYRGAMRTGQTTSQPVRSPRGIGPTGFLTCPWGSMDDHPGSMCDHPEMIIHDHPWAPRRAYGALASATRPLGVTAPERLRRACLGLPLTCVPEKAAIESNRPRQAKVHLFSRRLIQRCPSN